MGMSSYVMDCEEQFINSVNLRIGGCEQVSDMSDNEKLEFVEELWSEFWSDYA